MYQRFLIRGLGQKDNSLTNNTSYKEKEELIRPHSSETFLSKAIARNRISMHDKAWLN